MIHVAFTVYDVKAGAYLPPFFMRSNAAAMRAFSDAVNGGNEQFSSHPEDYVLFRIGTYDDDRGILDAEVPHTTLCKAIEVLKQPNLTPLEEAIEEKLSPRDRFEQECG